MPEYRCSRCESFLTVTNDPIHTGGLIVEPCENCINCEGCMFSPEED